MAAPYERSDSVSSTGSTLEELELQQGWLEKRGRWNTRWKRRWFWMEHQTRRLYYSAGPTKATKGSIVLDERAVFEAVKGDGARAFNVRTPSRTYYLRAENPREADMWRLAVRSFIWAANEDAGGGAAFDAAPDAAGAGDAASKEEEEAEIARQLEESARLAAMMKAQGRGLSSLGRTASRRNVTRTGSIVSQIAEEEDAARRAADEAEAEAKAKAKADAGGDDDDDDDDDDDSDDDDAGSSAANGGRVVSFGIDVSFEVPKGRKGEEKRPRKNPAMALAQAKKKGRGKSLMMKPMAALRKFDKRRLSGMVSSSSVAAFRAAPDGGGGGGGGGGAAAPARRATVAAATLKAINERWNKAMADEGDDDDDDGDDNSSAAAAAKPAAAAAAPPASRRTPSQAKLNLAWGSPKGKKAAAGKKKKKAPGAAAASKRTPGTGAKKKASSSPAKARRKVSGAAKPARARSSTLRKKTAAARSKERDAAEAKAAKAAKAEAEAAERQRRPGFSRRMGMDWNKRARHVPRHLEVRHVSDKVGRGLFARRALAAGDTVLRERRLLSVQNADCDAVACAECLHFLGDAETMAQLALGLDEQPRLRHKPAGLRETRPVQCKRECGVYYCSKECRLAAWNQHHQLLCQKDTLNGRALALFYEHAEENENERFQMAARVVASVMRLMQQGMSLEQALGPFKPFKKQLWWETVAPPDDLDLADAQMFTQTLIHMTRASLNLLRRALARNAPPETRPLFSLKFYGSLLGMFEMNNWAVRAASPLEPFAAAVAALPEAERARCGVAPEELAAAAACGAEGTGLFAAGACINHSCLPNVRLAKPEGDEDARFRDELAVVALRPIEEGEELLVAYVDPKEPYLRRRDALSFYGFECKCPKCLKDVLNLQMTRPRVQLFTSLESGSRQIKDETSRMHHLLRAHGVVYETIDVSEGSNRAYREQLRASRSLTYLPQVHVNGEYRGAFGDFAEANEMDGGFKRFLFCGPLRRLSFYNPKFFRVYHSADDVFRSGDDLDREVPEEEEEYAAAAAAVAAGEPLLDTDDEEEEDGDGMDMAMFDDALDDGDDMQG